METNEYATTKTTSRAEQCRCAGGTPTTGTRWLKVVHIINGLAKEAGVPAPFQTPLKTSGVNEYYPRVTLTHLTPHSQPGRHENDRYCTSLFSYSPDDLEFVRWMDQAMQQTKHMADWGIEPIGACP
jgi:hypothetical protein